MAGAYNYVVRGIQALGLFWALLAADACAARVPDTARDLSELINPGFRTLEGRLSDAGWHQPYRATSHGRISPTLPQPLIDEVARTKEAAQASQTAETLRAAARVELLLGDSARAIALLREATSLDSKDGRAWNDLAVALLQRSAESDVPDAHRVAALEAALAATELLPSRPEPWFNLGLAATWLSLNVEAANAWERSHALDTSAAWRNETRDRLSNRKATSDTWADARAAIEDLQRASQSLPEIAEMFPQQVEELLLDTLLPAWSRALAAGDEPAARAFEERSRALAGGVRQVAGDGYLSNCVDALAARKNAALAAAHIALAEGRAFFEIDQWDQARLAFDRSRKAFNGSSSACALWLPLQEAVRAFQGGEAQRALTLARGVQEIARKQGFLSLLARSESLEATASAGVGRLDQAVIHYDRAARLYDRTRQTEHRLVARGAEADAYRLMGETESGWSLVLTSLHNLSDIGRTRRRYQLFLNASLYAASEQLMRSAIAFNEASLRMARERKVANTIVEGLIRGADIKRRLGRSEDARADLKLAEDLLPSIESESVRRYQAAWLARGQAEAGIELKQADAVPRLGSAIDFLSTREPAEVPPIYLSMSRAARASGQMAAAEHSLHRGIAAFEKLWSGLGSDQHQISYLSDSWDLFDDLVELNVARGNTDLAFHYADAGRARALGVAGNASVPAASSIPRLDSRTVLLSYACLRDSLVIWRVDQQGLRHFSAPLPREALAARIQSFRGIVEAGAGQRDIRRSGESLYNDLITPVGSLPADSRLVLVPDGAMPGLPFAALVNPGTGRFLIEEHEVVMAPSVGFLDGVALSSANRGPLQVVAIGNAAPPGMPRLPDVNMELESVAGAYGSRADRSGAGATPLEFARLVRTADVIHFAGHAKANPIFPWRSSLVLAPDRQHDNGQLLASEIAEWRLTRAPLVVLSACQTAFGGASRNPGMLGLARAFLRAGARSIVGSLWDVDDRQSRALMTAFHQTFARAADAPAALRAAQIQLIRGSDPAGALPRNWASFLVAGGLAR